MSQILTLELRDRVFAAIQQQAENIGIPPERLAATLLEQNFSHIFKLLLTDAEKESRRAKFERHFGEIDLGFATDIDNEGHFEQEGFTRLLQPEA
ncbi:hypothetical protein [Lusitaniella coriacea]|uniref:hypothetical protein n=1 Tax=Lusitaniella coriacea TaxID=1983105 RepID=UPI003CF80DAF